MADESVRRLVELGVDASAAVSQLKKLENSTQSTMTSMDKLTSSAASMAKTFAAGVGIGAITAAAAGAVTAIRGMIDGMDDLSKAASNLGIAAKDFQELSYVFNLSGLDTGQTQRAIAALSEGIGQIGDDSKNTTRLLKSMGITAEDDVASAFDKMVTAVSAAPDGLNKTNVLMEIFGTRIGPKMVAVLNGGTEATRRPNRSGHGCALGACG